ncbi:DNA polymerase III subunit delta [bacterium]|nr:DNA polymerase III subunit delta [bacterium]
MPLYLFWGDEDYLIDKEISKLKKNVLKGDINALNYKRYDNPKFQELEGILRTTPMLFGDSLHIIKADKYFLNQKKQHLSDEEITSIAKDFELVSDRVHIVFTCRIPKKEDKKPDSRKKLYKTLAKFGTIAQFSAFKSYEDKKYMPVIQEMAKDKEIDISKDTIKTLVEISGTYLIDINSQLEKLKLYAYPNKKITPEMVEKISTVNDDVFTLVDLMAQGNCEVFMDKLTNLLEKSHYLEIFALLQTMIHKFIQLKHYSRTMSAYEIGTKLGQNPYRVELDIAKISAIPLEKLIQIKQNLTIAEFKLKSGAIEDAYLAFEQVILGGKLC